MERNLETLFLLGQLIQADAIMGYEPDWNLLSFGIGTILDSENLKEN